MLLVWRRHRSRRPLLAMLAGALCVASMASLTLPVASTASAMAAPATERTTDRVARAERALAAVESALAVTSGPARAAQSARPDLTLLLRDLVVDAPALPRAERRRAQSLLARPTGPGADGYDNPRYGRLPDGRRRPAGRVCGDHVCVHWVESGRHRVRDDGRVRTVPTWVRRNLTELEGVHGTYVAAGYRPVRPDGRRGGDARADVYLADVGSVGIYGYCTSDQRMPRTGARAVWAYCVLDNDFSRREFSTNSPLGNMRVTAAHEYFHAVQFAHDVSEDGWFMEATATWAEDELYDDVDDNLNYLSTSPLTQPAVPLDTFAQTFQYGEWIFFRFLTERLADEVGEMPTLVRDMWARAAGTASSPRGAYSLEAVRQTLGERGVDLGEAFAAFADANRHPLDAYSEAAENGYPVAPARRFDRAGDWRSTRLSHLSSASRSVLPTATSTQLTLDVDLPATSRGSYAVVSVYPVSGPVAPQLVALDADGDGTVTLPFQKAVVRRVDLTLVNASTRMRCRTGGDYSCGGTPRDDRLTAKFRATIR